MCIFRDLKRSKDRSTVKGLNKFLRLSVKLAEANAKIFFLKNCLEKHEYPKVFWKHLRRNHISPNSRTLKRHTLNQIDEVRSRLPELEQNISKSSHVLYELSEDERTSFENYSNTVTKKRTDDVIMKLNQSLKSVTKETVFPTCPEKYVYNYSDIPLSPIQMQILALGPKFCDATSKVNELNTKVQFENLIDQTKDLTPISYENADLFKSTVLSCCLDYINKKPSLRNVLSKEHRKQLKELKDNENLIITRPDKGSGIVLMNKSDYLNKLLVILSDEKKFQKQSPQKDPTEQTELQLTKILKKMKDESVISSKLYEQLRPSGSTTPRMYGLPKVHKQDVPLRPILDMIDSPYHTIAKWLVEI
ncbi:unnamed protein product, partial [Trichobilharzia szidati]